MFVLKLKDPLTCRKTGLRSELLIDANYIGSRRFSEKYGISTTHGTASRRLPELARALLELLRLREGLATLLSAAGARERR